MIGIVLHGGSINQLLVLIRSLLEDSDMCNASVDSKQQSNEDQHRVSEDNTAPIAAPCDLSSFTSLSQENFCASPASSSSSFCISSVSCVEESATSMQIDRPKLGDLSNHCTGSICLDDNERQLSNLMT